MDADADPYATAYRYHWPVIAAIVLAAAAILAADLALPQGYAVWVFYLPLCIGVAWFEKPREALAASGVASMLIAIGCIFETGPDAHGHALIARALETVTIWLAIALILFRQHATRAIRDAYEQAREANDSLTGIITNNAQEAIICVNELQEITLFNQGAERIFGYDAREVLGRDLAILLPAESAAGHRAMVTGFGNSTVAGRYMNRRNAVTAVRKDGTRFPVEATISHLTTRKGKVFTAILRDVSERQEQDRIAEERETRLRLALSAGQMGIFHGDVREQLLRVDQPRRPETPLDEAMTSGRFFELIHPDDRDRARTILAEAQRKGGEYTLEFRVAGTTSGEKWLAVHGITVLDTKGDAIRTLGVYYDITEHKRSEQELERRVAQRTAELQQEIRRREETQSELIRAQKLQAVGELAGGIAHDFNNLLTVISGNLELASLRQMDTKARDLLRRAGEATRMGARLAVRLLRIGGRRRLQPVTLDLGDIARNMTEVLKRTIGDHIDIIATADDGLWPVHADISEVENALLNLAINARDAMPDGGDINIRSTNVSVEQAGAGSDESKPSPGDYVKLSVSDTGKGIPHEILPRIFDPYFTTKEPGRGTGLGLSTVYSFAKQSGGHLEIDSVVGKGTTAHLYLPRANGNPVVVLDDLPHSDSIHGETILVVEDNPDVRDVAVRQLEALGYRVITATHGTAARDILQAGTLVDLVFSDVVMPGGFSGYDLARWIRENRPNVRILLTSGFTRERVEITSELGAIELLAKPYSITTLSQTIRRLLSA